MPRLSSAASAPTVASHFERCSPEVRVIYRKLLAAARALGPVEEDPKKTSIHLNRRTAFAGVATRKTALILTLKSETDLKSARITLHRQASARRWYLDLRLERAADLDRPALALLAKSYAISG